MKYALVIPFTCLLAGACWGQPSFSLSAPVFWGNIQVKDNWTPSTAPHYKEYRTGSSVGSGISMQGSFQSVQMLLLHFIRGGEMTRFSMMIPLLSINLDSLWGFLLTFHTTSKEHNHLNSESYEILTD